ncbi:DUF1206 domain-containing protein [Demequina litorisediminis]|uniref:DUF1206 domain-containing protein n=1 Tax=Demequina litorisediminis TaxID=1849022 RepID=A0ABQ6IE49_9MICO|nr:DUF1206 domain-containing protein [Demequina litorisediminis]GMA35028.1 hypothetical protein GCM10025876_12320 [Demequina litorisediminis]
MTIHESMGPLTGPGRSSSRAWETMARAGYAVSGALHLVLAFLIIRLPFSGGDADQSQALTTVGDAPGGTALLWVAVAGFVALGAWQAADATRRGQQASDRAKAAGKAVVYVALAGVAVSVALGGGSSSGGQAKGLTAMLLDLPGGPVIVGAVALGILATAVFHVWKGASHRFLDDLRATGGAELSTVVTATGTTGYIAKGIALGAVGVLFGFAALTTDADKAKGLDGAIESLLDLPGGPVIVVAVGLGFAAYGLYSMVRARYARM